MLELPGISLLRPWWLLALIPTALLLILLYRYGWQRSIWEQSLPRSAQQWLLQQHHRGGYRLRFIALGITWVLVVLALSGPAKHSATEPQRVDDSALVVILDLSRSMLSNDLPPNRLERARLKIRALLQDYADSQISLIVYAGSAHRVTPLSDDHSTLINLLNALTPDIMPSQGQAAIDSALTLAQQTIQQRPTHSSQILLLTSGLAPDDQQTLATHAATLGKQLSILGIGTHTGAPVPLPDGGFMRDNEGRILLPRLNSAQLAALARKHGARYHDITASNRDLDYLLQPFQSDIANRHNPLLLMTDYGHWFALLLLPIAALGARRGWLGIVLCLAILPQNSQALSWPDLWQRPDQQAMHLLEQQRPAAAAERFQDPQWKAWALYQAGAYNEAAQAWASLSASQPDNPAYRFNMGTALAMSGDYQAALEAYEHTLTLAPDHQPARHNRRQIEKLLEKLKQQQEQQTGQQEPPLADGQSTQSDQLNGQSAPDSASATAADEGNESTSNTLPGTTESGASSNNIEGSASHTDGTSTAGSAESVSDNTTGTSASSATDPRSTRQHQQELEQWLQEIPDDPAELLRRKFLYQHLQQQDNTP